jgi:alpha-glucosidase (family GH31 glycosyl hydrolase)
MPTVMLLSYVVGVPPMRPLWYEFPKDEVTFGREGSHMLGEALLVTPVLQKSTTQGSKFLLRHSCAQNL